MSIKSREVLTGLCEAALDAMDVELAIWIYRHQGHASMVMSLERVKHIEDKNLLAGHILVLKDADYNTAQELFLRSSYPQAALEMRKDLKHWEEALKLADQLDPDSIGQISREYGGMLEVRGDYPSALDYYQQVRAPSRCVLRRWHMPPHSTRSVISHLGCSTACSVALKVPR